MVKKKRLRADKREAILVAAAREISERGYKGTSMDIIAKEADVSKRTVYNHFENKEELFRAVVDEMFQRAGEGLYIPYDSKAPLDEQLTKLAQLEAEFLMNQENIAPARALLSECISSPGFAEKLFEDMACHEAGIARWIREATEDGRLAIDNVHQASELFISMLKGQLFWPRIIGWNTEVSQDELDNLIKTAVGMFLGYYQK